ncbi:MAG: protease HtpX [Betaproteobacteria bacterium]|nr:protease HtpX [Betaproteobacteria bacterium]
MKRVFLFLVTNLAVILVLSIVVQLLVAGGVLPTERQTGWYGLLVIAALFGMGGAFISLAISKWSAKHLTGARVIVEPADPVEHWLLQAVRRHASQAGVGMPEVAIYESPELNAFATGWSRNHALIAVSRGLLDSMTPDEVDAVLGHELTHVADGDMVTLALLQGVVNTFVIFLSRIVGYFVDRVIFRNEREDGLGYLISVIVAQIVLGFLATIVVMWFSRHREFRADAGGARLAGRDRMIAALVRLKKSVEAPALPAHLQAFGIFGQAGRGLTRLFMSHPPLEERIAALSGAQ